MSDKTLANEFMKGGNVAALADKIIQEAIDPSKFTAMMMELDKASAIRKDQQSITDGEVTSIRTYGVIEQMKANFAKKYVENADVENINPLLEQKVKLYCLMNKNPELPLKSGQDNTAQQQMQKNMNPLLRSKMAEKSGKVSR